MLEVSLATHVLRFDLADSAAHLNSGFTSALKTLDPSSNDTQAFSRLVQQFGSTFVHGDLPFSAFGMTSV